MMSKYYINLSNVLCLSRSCYISVFPKAIICFIILFNIYKFLCLFYTVSIFSLPCATCLYLLFLTMFELCQKLLLMHKHATPIFLLFIFYFLYSILLFTIFSFSIVAVFFKSSVRLIFYLFLYLSILLFICFVLLLFP